jgi:hypothetical protein
VKYQEIFVLIFFEFNFTNSNIKNFNFILINETNINYKFDGIFGLSKGAIDIQNLLIN